MDFLDHAQSDTSTPIEQDAVQNMPISDNLSKDLESFERGTVKREVQKTVPTTAPSTVSNTVSTTAKKSRKKVKQNNLDVALDSASPKQKNKVTFYLSDDDLLLLETVKANHGMYSIQDSMRCAIAALRDALGAKHASS